MISISLCMIIKNEQETIARCLNSVNDLMDEIIIVDTGSDDSTLQIVSAYTDKVFNFRWNDNFAAARNFSFQQATKDYLIWLDADDVFLPEDHDKLADLKNLLAPSVDCVSMKYDLDFDEYGNVMVSNRRNRLVKKIRNFHWHGAIHEYLLIDGKVFHSNIAITHKKLHPRSDRNLRVYEKLRVKGEEFTLRDLYYYANELRDHRRYAEAITYYEKFLNTQKGWVEDQISACVKLADCCFQLGNSDKGRAYLYKSFDYDRPRAEVCCLLGFHFLQQKDIETALFWYKFTSELQFPKTSMGFVHPACWTWLPHLMLSECYYYLGEYEKALRHNAIARTFRPDDESILSREMLLEQKMQPRREQVDRSLEV